MSRRVLAGMLVALAVVATACYRPYDFTGGDKADRVYLTADGVWRIAGSSTTLWTSPAGADWAVPGNYDATAKWEAAATDGTNWYTAGKAGTIAFPFPEADLDDAIPVPADYDGDAATEPAWWSRATGTWYIQDHDPVVFGTPGDDSGCATYLGCLPYLRADVPVPADYDGDARAELAVYNPIHGSWRFEESGATLDLGALGDIPAVADYDGDGTQDPAVYDRDSGMWLVEGVGSLGPFGANVDPGVTYPVPADYTGDGRAELSVVHQPSTGSPEWIVDGGTSGILTDADGYTLGLAEMQPSVRGSFVRMWYVGSCVDNELWNCPGLLDTPHDFVGDEAADRVWIEPDGAWRAEGVATPLWTGPVIDPTSAATARAAAADYDGDGKWEPATVDLAGTWVTAGSAGAISFASPEAATSPADQIPVPADYDGDAAAEPAWYSRATGTWYVLGADPVAFGVPGPFPTTVSCGSPWSGVLPVECRAFLSADVPVPGDWDGDGDAEPAVWSPLTGEWRVLGEATVVTLGGPSVWPAPADYDGDRTIDAAVWGLGTTDWVVDGLGVLGSFVASGYPVPADYTGDGDADPSWASDEWGAPDPNTWDGPDLEPLTYPSGSWAADIPTWLLPYAVPLTALDICDRFNPDRCGLS